MKQSLKNMDRLEENTVYSETETPSVALINFDSEELTNVKQCLRPDTVDKKESSPGSSLSCTNSAENKSLLKVRCNNVSNN